MPATAIVMPKLGMTMEEGTVVRWPIAVGGPVEKGQAVLVIESEKTEAEIEATAAGVLRHVYVPEGATVPCGELLGAITARGDEPFDAGAFAAEHARRRPSLGAARAAAARADAPPASPGGLAGRGARASPVAAAAARAAGAGRRPIAPAARALAREFGVDPETVAGSGPSGRVTREDVRAHAERRRRLRPASGGVALEVPTLGEGDPVLLLPGFGTDVSSFAPQGKVLARHHSVWGVNPRGVGLSDAPELPRYDVATAAADVAALAPERFHVVGASLGAAVALELALAYPERVRSLALVTPFVEAGARLLAVLELWCRVAAEASAEVLASALLPWLFSETLLADPAARARTARGLAGTLSRAGPAALARSASGLRAWSGTRARDLGRVAARTLVVVAGGDLLTPGGERIAGEIPGARCFRAEGSGHAVCLEAAEEVTRALELHLGLP